MDITHSFWEMKLREKNQEKKNKKFKWAWLRPDGGVGRPSYKKTQLDHDI